MSWPIIAMMLICMGAWIVIAFRRRLNLTVLLAGVLVIMAFFGLIGNREGRPGIPDSGQKGLSPFGTPDR